MYKNALEEKDNTTKKGIIKNYERITRTKKATLQWNRVPSQKE